MTNENIDRNRFLSVFRREWEMYKTRDEDPARKPSSTQAPSSATFDQPVAGGELRLFGDFPSPLTGLLVGVSAKGWRVVPVSPFTVPASDREILIGSRGEGPRRRRLARRVHPPSRNGAADDEYGPYPEQLR